MPFQAVASLADISRKGALDAIVGLYRQDPKPMGAMEFARAAGVDPGTASRAREELHAVGIIDAKIVREQGAVREYEIRLTDLGRKLAPLAAEMGRVLVEDEAKSSRVAKRGP